MINQNILHSFNVSYRGFRDSIQSLSNEQFLSKVNDRTARGIVAHLIGWNRLMIESSEFILAGKTPTYFADAPNDYCHINAEFMARYSSQSKQELLATLDSTKEKLEAFISTLSADDLIADYGVKHYSGEPATVTRIIKSLAGDYEYHMREISEWFGK